MSSVADSNPLSTIFSGSLSSAVSGCLLFSIVGDGLLSALFNRSLSPVTRGGP